jgi:DnaK suppressor protein
MTANNKINNDRRVAPNFKGEKKKRYEQLLQLRDELLDQVRNLSSSALTFHREAGEDLADVGSENFSRDMGLALMTEEGHKVALIQDAIERLIDGSYGTCIDCDGSIGSGRLDAIPYAKLCIDCKSIREDYERMGQEPPVKEEEELVE